MAVSKCWDCRYETSDCKGIKSIENVNCQYFQKKLAINYPQKIRELEKKINRLKLLLNLDNKLCEVFRNEINRLKATLKQADEAYDSQGKQLLEALDRIEQLKLDNEGYKAEARLEKRDNAMVGNQSDKLFKENEQLKEHIKSLDDIILKLKEEAERL